MSFFTGRDCLSYGDTGIINDDPKNLTTSEQLYNMRLHAMKCTHMDDCECDKIIWYEEDQQPMFSAPVPELNNYPAIVAKYYKSCPQNINDLKTDNEYKLYFIEMYEKLTSLIELFNIDKDIYNALLNNLRTQIRKNVVAYDNKYLIEYEGKHYNILDDEINKHQILSIVYYTPTQKDNHTKLIVPTNIPEFTTYYDVLNNPNKIFKYKDMFSGFVNDRIIKKLESISKLININDIINLFKEWLMEIILSKLKVYRFYNNDSSQDILYYNGKLLNETTVKVNGYDCPMRYIGYNTEIHDFVMGEYDNTFVYKVGNIEIPYNGINIEIINITNKFIEYNVDGNTYCMEKYMDFKTPNEKIVNMNKIPKGLFNEMPRCKYQNDDFERPSGIINDFLREELNFREI